MAKVKTIVSFEHNDILLIAAKLQKNMHSLKQAVNKDGLLTEINYVQPVDIMLLKEALTKEAKQSVNATHCVSCVVFDVTREVTATVEITDIRAK